jgi:predicted nucleic acid-binding protein
MMSFAGSETNGMSEDTSRPRVYLDTNVFIRAFEAETDESRHMRVLFEELRMHRRVAVTSELTLAELLAPVQRKGAKPLHLKPLHLKRRFYLSLIVWSGFIDLYPTTRSVWLETADMRQYAKGLKLPDAVHLVTAVQARCSCFISDDRRLSNLPKGLRLVRPDESGVAAILEALRV